MRIECDEIDLARDALHKLDKPLCVFIAALEKLKAK